MAPSLHATRWLFLRLLAVVFLIAFVSYWVQLDGLIGSEGILPAADFMAAISRLGPTGWWQAPTFCWFGASDVFLHTLAASGTVLSLLLLADVAPGLVLLLLWALYLSLVVVGQTFFTFQWDMLLLETALTSLFVAPWRLRPRHPSVDAPVPRAGWWLLRSLLFKLMFLSGITKLVCLDETWWGCSALDFHYFTQPLPVFTSWYAQHLPHGFQRASVAVMFAVELGAPFLLFFPRRFRVGGAAAILALMVLIGGTGNYGFFNVLTAVLCVTWLDDAIVARWLPALRKAEPAAAVAARPFRLGRALYAIAVGVLAFASSYSLIDEIVRTRPPGRIDGIAGKLLDYGAAYVAVVEPAVSPVEPFRSINGYGLFRAMTTKRPEIAIETSDDGAAWHEVVFRYKAGEVHRPPRFVAPHQPRLDWQMWFAALNPRRAGPWIEGLMLRILEGSPPVIRLLDDPALYGRPPRFIRLVMYDYRFTTPEEAAAQGGAWWVRERRGEMTTALSLENFKR